MTAARIIPSGAAKTVATWTLRSDGEEVPRTVHLLSVATESEVGRIPSATLVLKDGDPAAETFAVSEAAWFAPGAAVEVQLGYRASNEPVFTGIVVRQTIKLRSGGSMLVVYLKASTERMAQDRRSRYFHEVTDSDVIEALIEGHGLEKEVSATDPVHTSMVQHEVTDWDMLVCRADASGRLVSVEGDTVRVFEPDLGAEPKLSIQYGATVYELDAEVDARLQTAGVRAQPWVPADQALADPAEASEPDVPQVGNLAAQDLADVFHRETSELRHGAPLASDEVQAWVDAKLLRHRLAKIRGRVTTDGTRAVKPGDFIELLGVGERFAGKLFVSGVGHSLEQGAWKTTLQFGLDPDWFVTRFDILAPPAGGLLPALRGLLTGVVVALEGDPEDEGRIRVRIPVIHGEDEGAWCRLATLDAGNERGTFFRPELEDEVVVGFVDCDPRHGVVLGQLHSSNKAAPEAPADDNHLKGYQSRSGIRLTFDDDETVAILETPEGNRLRLSEADAVVELTDQSGNEVVLSDQGIKLKCQGNFEVDATGDVTLKASGSLSVEGQQSTRVSGGSASEVALGPQSADLSGPIVNIN